MIIDQSSTYYSNYGTTRCRIELIDGTGNNLYNVEAHLPTYSEVIDIPETENVELVRFAILEANNYYNSNLCILSEFNILEEQNGQYISLVQKSNQGNYTASSEWKTNCYSYYPVSNLIDGNTESYWMSAQNDTPNYGVYPSVEITLSTPQTVSQIVISGGSLYQYYGITRTKIELFDDNEIVLYSQEHDLQATTEINLPNTENVLKARFTALESPDPYNYNCCTWGEITLYKKHEEPQITTTDIGTTLSADTTVSIYIVDSDGNIVSTLVNNESRQQGTYNDNWDTYDDNGFKVTDGIYYAIMEYEENSQKKTLDLRGTTGGERFLPQRDTTGGTYNDPALAKPFEDEFLSVNFTINQAAEVTFFVGVLNYSDTRIRTIMNRVPMPAGTHKGYWDGLDDNENIAEPPPGDQLVLGLWGYALPDNAIFMTGGTPEITDLDADPNYFDPFSEKCDENGNGEGITLTYNLSEDVTQVELRVYSLATGNLVRTIVKGSQQAGENYFFWDGKDNTGKYTAMGDYQVGIMATDADGNNSMFKYTLARILY